jgi:hypothetical protein
MNHMFKARIKDRTLLIFESTVRIRDTTKDIVGCIQPTLTREIDTTLQTTGE